MVRNERQTKIIFRLIKLRDSGNLESRTVNLQIAYSEVWFGGSSDFGSHNPSPFFELPSACSEWPATGFGIVSVSVGNLEGPDPFFPGTIL